MLIVRDDIGETNATGKEVFDGSGSVDDLLEDSRSTVPRVLVEMRRVTKWDIMVVNFNDPILLLQTVKDLYRCAGISKIGINTHGMT